MRLLPLLALGLMALPSVTASTLPPLEEDGASASETDPTLLPALADPTGLCPPRDRNDTYLVLYCAAMYGIPKSVDRFHDNMTQGPVTANETVSQARLLVHRVRGCMDGRYPPCPRMVGEML